jgi:hypothetical protein
MTAKANSDMQTIIRQRLASIRIVVNTIETQVGPHLPPLFESRLAGRTGDMLRELRELLDQARLFQPDSDQRL